MVQLMFTLFSLDIDCLMSVRSCDLDNSNHRYCIVDRISCTCPECTDGQRGSRIQQLPELPTQCRTARCSDSQRDPGHHRQKKCKISSNTKSHYYWNVYSWTWSKRAATYSQTRDVWQQVLLGNFHLIHQDHASGGRPQRELSLNLGGWQTLHSTLQDETPHLAVLTLGPNHCDVCHGGICDPSRGWRVKRFSNINCMAWNVAQITVLFEVFSFDWPKVSIYH